MLKPDTAWTWWGRGLALISLTMLGGAVTALPVLRTDFLKLSGVKASSKVGSEQCTLCHLPNGTKLNPFGLDMQKSMKAAKTRKLTAQVIKQLATLDSDKDKFTNEREWKADTLPGDPKSKPAK